MYTDRDSNSSSNSECAYYTLVKPKVISNKGKNKMEEFTLTKEEFIGRSMKGERFKRMSEVFSYDNTKDSPFRVDGSIIRTHWRLFNGVEKFLSVKPEPTIERRWIWLKDFEGRTKTSDRYMTDKAARGGGYAKNGWYKATAEYCGKDIYIDVKIKGE